MRRVTLIVLTLWLLCTGLLGIMILIGQQQPASLRLQTLYLTECAPPCWIGIVPGQTSLGEARRIIEGRFKPPVYKLVWDTQLGVGTILVSFYQLPNEKTPAFSVRVQHNLAYIEEILFILPRGSEINDLFPTLADVILRWGTPSLVNPSLASACYNDKNGKTYMRLAVSYSTRIKLSENLLWFVQPVMDYCGPVRTTSKLWRGFANWDRYLQP